MRKLLKVTRIMLLVFLVIALFVYFFILQYPNLKKNPAVGKWYRVTSREMKTSVGGRYRAFFKKGSENKVMVYFAGGGVSINEETARDDTYNTKEIYIDLICWQMSQ